MGLVVEASFVVILGRSGAPPLWFGFEGVVEMAAGGDWHFEPPFGLVGWSEDWS